MPTPKSRKSAGEQASKLGSFDQVWAITDISKLHHSGNGIVTYVGNSLLQEEDIGTVRSVNPIHIGSTVMVTIIDPGEKCYIAVGLCHKDYPDNLLPGWTRVSIGFHADSGNLFINGSDGLPFGQPCSTNDCIECDLLPSDIETSVVVVFKHNGRELGSRELRLPVGGFHAVVGMMTPGEKVHLCVMENNSSLHCTPSNSNTVAMVTKGATKQVLYQSNLEYDTKENLFKSVASARGPGFVMFCPPLSERLCYFEVEVVHLGQDSDLVIGLASRQYPNNILPGVEKHSIVLHCNDGSIKCDGVTVLSAVPSYSGDVIGCLVKAEYKFDCIQPSDRPHTIPLIFYRNGKEIVATTTCEINNGLYPVVGTVGNNVLFKTHYTVGRKPSDYFVHYKIPEGYMNINVEREINPHWITSGQHVVNGVFSVTDVRQSHTAVYTVPLTMLHHHYTVTLRKRNNEFAEFAVGLAIFSSSADDISVASILGSLLFSPLVGLVKKDNNTVYNFTPNVCHSLVKCNYFGVGIDPRSKSSDHIDVFFTCDDQELYRINIACSKDETMYPMILSKCASLGEAFHVVNPSYWPPVLQLGEPWGIGKLSPRCTAVANSLVQYSGDSNTEQVGAIQAAFPLTPHHRYFEFRVYRRGNSYNPCIGIGLAERDYALNYQPGWMDNSIAYHLDDGNLFHNSSYANVGPLCSNDGDQFGCGLVFSTNPSSRHALVFFTKNSCLIACKCAQIPSSGFFPTIGLHTAATVIDVDLNASLLVDVPPYPYEWQTVSGVKVAGNVLTLTATDGCGVVQFATSAQVRYLRIDSLSKKETLSITLGYKSITINSSSASLVCIKIPKNKIILNQSMVARLPLDSTAIDSIGCGIEESQSSHSVKVFVTANKYLIYSFYTSEFTVEDVSAVVEIKAHPGYSKEIDAHSLWPPTSAIGKGWANVVNLNLYHNNNISYLASEKSRFGFAQAAQPLSVDCPYFEVEILRRDKASNIAVGLTSIHYNDWPGSRPVSIAYYASTGCVHCSSEKPTKRVCKLFSGDVIGCGVRELYGSLEQFNEERNRQYEIFFTVNGHLVYARDATDLFHPSLLYPAFALENNEDEVVVRLNIQFPSYSIGNEWGHFSRIVRSGYLYEHSHTGLSDMKLIDPGVLQAAEPLTKQRCYFTLSIISCVHCVSIGIAPRISCSVHSTSTYTAGGVMYSSSGQLSVYSHGGARRTMSLERCSVGDTMSCGIEYKGSLPSLVKFYHNETMISSQKLVSSLCYGPLYSTFSLDQPGDVIRIDLDTEEPMISYDSDIIGWLRTSNVMIKNGIIMYASKQSTKSRLPIGFAQVAQIIDGKTLSYYEVEILQRGQKCTISVGLATPSYSIEAHPGWYAESIAFHGDDGRLFNSVGTGVPFCHPWKQGDVVGIGIRNIHEAQYTCCNSEEAQVFFTRNGTEIGCTTIEVPFCQLYPTIGMHSFGECVKIDLNAAPPRVHAVQRSQWRILTGVKITSATDLSTTLEYDHPMYQPSSFTVTIALAVSAKPFSAGCRYAEITIHSLGVLNAVIIGAVEKNHPLENAPGWVPNSIAYHSDDGKLYKNSQRGSTFGPICHPGDVMGIKYHCSGSSNCTIIFTQNGHEVGCEQIALPQSGFFPAVGMASPGDKVTVKFQETFSSLYPMPPPVTLSPMRISNIMFSGHVLTYNRQQSNGTLGMAVFSRPFGENFKGFSVNLINQASNVYIGIVSRDYSISTAPGKKPFSCAYCTSSGLVYECLNITSNLRTHRAVVLTKGDTLGCKIEDQDDNQYQQLVFTQSRKRVVSINFSKKSMKTTPLYPVVAVDNIDKGDNQLLVTSLYIDSNPHNYTPLNHF